MARKDKIIEYIKQRYEELDNVAVVDYGTYSSAKETYQKVINMLEEMEQEVEDEIIDEDIVEIISHTYYTEGKVIRTETDYRYNNYQYYKHKDGSISTCPEIKV